MFSGLSIFRIIHTREEVARILDINYDWLIRDTITSNPAKRYSNFEIKKKTGGVRIITAPSASLKFAQTRLNLHLQELYKPKPSAHGFVKGRSILSNASKHIGKKHVLNIDLKDFFPSINFGRVRGMLMAKPYELNSEIATIFAQICCHENSLPQGAPTSPIISNMICAKMDSQLQKLANKHGCVYSRYADDITFSTTKSYFPKDLAIKIEKTTKVGKELEHIIKSNGFEINDKKVRLQSLKEKQEVTGLTVNEFPNTSRKFIRQVRSMLNAWEKYGLTNAQKEHYEKYNFKHRKPSKNLPSFSDIARGKLAFLKHIRGKNDPVCQSLEYRFILLTGGTIPLTLSTREKAEKSSWVLESPEGRQGTAFLLKDIGLITCQHVIEDGMYAFQISNPSIQYPIRVIKSCETVDLAILEFDAPIEHCFEQRSEPQLEPDEIVMVVGYPKFQHGNSVSILQGVVTSTKMVSSIRRLITSARIISGNSGGAVLDKDNYVVGVAVTGADNIVEDYDVHGIIPIGALKHLL